MHASKPHIRLHFLRIISFAMMMLLLSESLKYLLSSFLSVYVLFNNLLLFDAPFFAKICTHVLLIFSQRYSNYVSDLFLLCHIVKVGKLFQRFIYSLCGKLFIRYFQYLRQMNWNKSITSYQSRLIMT